MKIINYNTEEFNNYKIDLKMIGSLSLLFANGDVPMLDYRIPENLYCMSFGATNLARSCVTADAKLGNVGIGIKTFLEQNKKTWQKIAEFDKKSDSYSDLDPKEKIIKIAELRNERIISTMNIYRLDSMIYHCVIRNKNGFHFYEEPMELIDIKNIKNVREIKNTIFFEDGKHEYSFNKTKSTLLKRFYTNEYFDNIEVVIAQNPIELLRNSFASIVTLTENETIVMPLYSVKDGIKFVPQRSGLNQWNAGGRARNVNEVYIPFPAKLRKKYAGFFPDKDTCFDVTLPSGKIISMKVCQQDGKAIMSNPNKELGEWILREVLQLEEQELVTYEKLASLGIDSVSFEKDNDGKYSLDFRKIILDDDSEIQGD